MYVENINYCLREKEEKIRSYYQKYETWWLIFVDTIFGAGPKEYSEVIQEVNKSKLFDKVVVISYETKNILFEF